MPHVGTTPKSNSKIVIKKLEWLFKTEKKA
jgi:hypothetical protein